MSHNKPFTLFSHATGPNPWKVEMLLNELGLVADTVYVNTSAGEHKSTEFTSKYNPNGRIPALVDHSNNDFAIWESDAILLYLVEKYDTERKFSFDKFEDKMLLNQWLIFQASGQGPYFGQAGWFKVVGPEIYRIPLAIERYQKEILRVFGVIESVLSKQEWLVGGKYSIADLSFVIWNEVAINLLVNDYNGFNFEKDYPSVYKWHQALIARPAIAKALALRKSLITK